MTALRDELPWHRAESLETHSGKWRGSENFPVGSFLIRRGLRSHVHAFYRFARNADDIADNPALAADDKIRRLDRMAAILGGAPRIGSPAASPALRRVIDSLLDRTETLIATARGLPPRVAARGLRWESAVIVALAARLARRLRQGDPLATRVVLRKGDVAAAFL